MQEDIVKKMREYLAKATKEQLAEDYKEIVNNHEGPTVKEYFQYLKGKITTEFDLIMEEKYLLHDASKEMPDKNTDILFRTKEGKWLQGYCHKDVLVTADAFYEQSDIEEWCYLKDVSSL